MTTTQKGEGGDQGWSGLNTREICSVAAAAYHAMIAVALVVLICEIQSPSNPYWPGASPTPCARLRCAQLLNVFVVAQGARSNNQSVKCAKGVGKRCWGLHCSLWVLPHAAVCDCDLCGMLTFPVNFSHMAAMGSSCAPETSPRNVSDIRCRVHLCTLRLQGYRSTGGQG